MKLYLVEDVLILFEVFEKVRDTMFENYKLDPSWFITPSLAVALAAALLKSKTKIDFLTKIDIITEIESSIRGG